MDAKKFNFGVALSLVEVCAYAFNNLSCEELAKGDSALNRLLDAGMDTLLSMYDGCRYVCLYNADTMDVVKECVDLCHDPCGDRYIRLLLAVAEGQIAIPVRRFRCDEYGVQTDSLSEMHSRVTKKWREKGIITAIVPVWDRIKGREVKFRFSIEEEEE